MKDASRSGTARLQVRLVTCSAHGQGMPRYQVAIEK
jgi:hypothetical protein